MSDGPVPAPREQGWSRILLALAAFLLLPHALVLPAFLPMVDTLLLLLPAVAVCCVLGWREGGSPWLAAIWAGLTVWLFSLPAPGGVSEAYYDLARAWGLLAAGTFGVVYLVGRQRSFVHRSLAALGLAVLLALLLVVFGRLDLHAAQHVFAEELTARDSAALASLRMGAEELTDRLPQLASLTEEVVARQHRLQQVLSGLAAPLYPALLALEALAGLALAWALYHRLSRVRLGAPLAPLKQFAFNDQLGWAMVVGITLLLVPSLQALSTVGWNLVVFFGTLYALRGYGIYAWLVSRRAAAASLVVAIALFPLSLVTVPAALGLGLSDTVFDWRRRIPVRRGIPPQ